MSEGDKENHSIYNNQSTSNAIPHDENVAQQTNDENDEHTQVDTQENQNLNQDMDDSVHEELHTSFLQPERQHQFTTPSKDLPALKDIEPIVTPKSFSVAKDSNDEIHMANSSVVASSPIKHRVLINDQPISQDSISAIVGYLSVDESEVRNLNEQMFKKLLSKSTHEQELVSEANYYKLKIEQLSQTTTKTIEQLQSKYTSSDNLVTQLQQSHEELTSQYKHQESKLKEIEAANLSLKEQLTSVKQSDFEKDQEIVKLKSGEDQRELVLHQQISQLTATNIEQSTKLNELASELNNERNSKFQFKLDSTKLNNEVGYLRDQKIWYDQELKSSQQRYTDLINKHESEFFSTSSKIQNLTAKNETLEKLNYQYETTITGLKNKLEEELIKKSKSETDYESEKNRFLKEISSKEELLELSKLQSEQRQSRIEQLESYSNEVKNSLSTTIAELESKISDQSESIIELSEKLKRTEEALDQELHKETELPKLNDSSALIASNGISLSTLYSEYNHLRKQLATEKLQKQKVEQQLESFIHELDTKKPAMSNYRVQIQFYESSLQEVIGKVETVRAEKAEVEKDASRLRSRLADNESELTSLRKLLKDLGRQLCYYLLHSNVRDNDEAPLTLSEKSAIDKIINKTSTFDDFESDTDKLISERLVEFKSIIELRQKNEELLLGIRQLSETLESKEEETNNFENEAVEAAKEAILTLQGELDSSTIKLETITKERDALRSMTGGIAPGSETNYLIKANDDLRNKVGASEKIIEDLRKQSSTRIIDLNEKLREVTDAKNELALQISVLQKSSELADSRLSTCQQSLENSRGELNQMRNEIEFWRSQSNKLESQLVSKSQQVHDLESKVSSNNISLNNLEREKEFKESLMNTLNNEIETLRQDKIKLNEFVLNLQSIVKEREESSKDMTGKYSSSIENFHLLQQKLLEKDERIQILTNQTELSLKAQNTKLEQINEISYQLLTSKNRLLEKEQEIEDLKYQLKTKPNQPSMIIDTTDGDNSEISQIKQDLKNSELQKEEYLNLAKAAETALINATNTFESYKAKADINYQQLMKEKETLDAEFKKLSKALNLSVQNLESLKVENSTEINNLKVKLGEFQIKADSYDNLDQDYKNKLTLMQQDIQNQTKLYNEAQIKFQEQLDKNQSLTEQVDELRSEIDNKIKEAQILQAEINDLKDKLVEKDELLANENSQIQNDLLQSNQKVEELKEQNNILLNQIELTKTASTDDETDIKQVVNYLRREKESNEAKLLVALEENKSLKLKLEQIQVEMLRTKSAFDNKSLINIDSTVKKHEQLSQDLEQLNILKESNSTLRYENKKSLEQIDNLTARLTSLTAELESLRNQVNDLNSNYDFESQQNKLLIEENDRLKSFKAKTSETSSTPESVASPEIVVKLQNEIEHLKKSQESIPRMQDQMDRLKDKANAKIAEYRTIVQSRDEQIKELEKKLEVIVNSGNSSTEIQAKDNTIKQLQSQIDGLANVNGSSTTSQANEVRIKELEKQIEELSQPNEALTQDLNNQLSSLQDELKNQTNEKNELLQKLNSLESNLKSQFENEKAKITQSMEEHFKTQQQQLNGEDSIQKFHDVQNQYKDLQSSLEKMRQDSEQKIEDAKTKVRAETEMKFQLKIKMLTRKLENYEKNSKPEATSTPTSIIPPQTTPSTKTVTTTNTNTTPKPTAAHPGSESTLKVHKPTAHPGNESTLTVRRPPVARTEDKKFSPPSNSSTTTTNVENRKRANEAHQQRPQIKKPKDDK